MPDRKLRALELAAKCGTYNKFDRSKQYENDPEIRSVPALLRSQNHQWTKIRKLELYLKLLLAAQGTATAVYLTIKLFMK